MLAPAAAIFAPTFTFVGSTGIGSRTETGNLTKKSAFDTGSAASSGTRIASDVETSFWAPTESK